MDVMPMSNEFGFGLVRCELEVLVQRQLVCGAQVRERSEVDEPQLFKLLMMVQVGGCVKAWHALSMKPYAGIAILDEW